MTGRHHRSGGGGPSASSASYPGPVVRTRGRRWRRYAVALVLVAVTLVGAWLWICIDRIANPQVEALGPVDAVFVLGPAETRIDETLAIMDTGVAPVLLATTSVRPDGSTYATDHCGTRTPMYVVECVVPDPYSTRGEARVLGEQIEAHGWRRVAVVTSTPHAARARMMMERCTDADVLIWTVDDMAEMSASGWARAFIYQSSAWLKAQILRDC